MIERNFLALFDHAKASEWISNCEVDIDFIETSSKVLPITVNQTYYTNSYTVSFYSANIRYAIDELHLIGNPWVEKMAHSLLWMMGSIFKWFECDRMAIINNWMFSTNFHPSMNAHEVQSLTHETIKRFPAHYIAMRSINSLSDAALIESLQSNGWHLLPARSVYMFDTSDSAIFKHNHTKKDQKLLAQTHLRHIEPHEWQEEDFKRLKVLFDQLFIEKHSHLNPDFSAQFLYHLHTKGIIEFHGFASSEEIVAFIGFFTQHKIISTPMLGYDTTLPQEMGLYRILMALLLKTAKERSQMLNLSSGAGSFKRSRGGKATLEYTAVYVEHLSFGKKMFIRMLDKVLNRTLPKAFEKYEI